MSFPQRRGFIVVKKAILPKATKYGFVFWFDTKKKKRTNKKEIRWQKR
jgi:hypothetical protein